MVFLNDNKLLFIYGLIEVGIKSMCKIVYVFFIEYWLCFNIVWYFCIWMFLLFWMEKLMFLNFVKGNC